MLGVDRKCLLTNGLRRWRNQANGEVSQNDTRV
jgi:hypothetical protein